MKNKLKEYWLLGIKLIPKLFTTLVKSVKFIKLALFGASLAAYSALFSFKVALLIVVGISIHESFHVLAMKKIGMKTKGFFLIPFLGGVAIGSEAFKTYKDNVFVSIAGPISGIILSIPALMLYYLTKDISWLAVVSWLALVNMFNLLPMGSLDGGQIVQAIFYSINSKVGYFAALLSSIAFIIFTFHFHLLLLAIFATLTSITYFAEGYRFLFKNYPLKVKAIKMNTKQIIISSLAYVSVFLSLFILMQVCAKLMPESSNIFEILD